MAVEAQPAAEAGAPVGAEPGGDVKKPTTGQPAREPEQTSERQSFLGRLVRADDRGRLWPWGSTMAFLAAVLLFLILAAVLYGASRGVGWPARRDGGALVYLVTLVGLTPVWLLLLDSLSRNRAVLEVRGIKLDYSARASAAPDIELELNLLPPMTPLMDSSTQLIEDTLVKAAAGETAVIDLALGDGWWNTRLLALSIGAAEHGAPQRLVVLGTAGRAGVFLGWVRPEELGRVLLAADTSLREARDEAYAIGGLVTLFRPSLRPNLEWPSLLTDYFGHPVFNRGGAESRRLILYDRLGKLESVKPRSRLSPAELVAIAGPVLHTETLDRSWSKRRQIRALLEASDSHVALVTDGNYERLLDAAEERVKILRQLVLRDD